MKLIYYKNLDGVRAIAVFMVMIFHFCIDVHKTDPIIRLISKVAVLGKTGVELFFVLSGFLITRILLSTKNESTYFKNFYVRRILRIMPLYYLFLLIYYFVSPLVFTPPQQVPFSQQIYFYTYLQNVAFTFHWKTEGPFHYWSLAVEEHFYLFWPLVIYFTNPKTLYKIIGLIIVAAFALRIYMVSLHYPVHIFTFTRFDSLAFGALLALIETDHWITAKNSIKFLLLAATALVPLAMVLIYLKDDSGTGQVVKFFLLPLFYFSLVGYVLCIPQTHFVNRLLKLKFLAYTGKISFGLYVFHIFCYALANRYFPTKYWPIQLATGLSLAYIVASFSFYFFESNFLKLKKYFEYDKAHRITPKGALEPPIN
jgi:peptidoglycan/LPS O-acetylase OafA/YrhL